MSQEPTRSKKNNNFLLSRALSALLRHDAPKHVTVLSGGFVRVNDILKLSRFKRWTVADISKVVETNDKKRFSVQPDDNGNLLIRANQGHTFPVDEEELFESITNSDDYPVVIHGTYKRFWDSIKSSGLSRAKRNHIHFAPGLPGDAGVISGMRTSVELYIYIDMKRAMQDGLKFYRSSNNVILTPGDEHGYILKKYFTKVEDVKTKGDLLNS